MQILNSHDKINMERSIPLRITKSALFCNSFYSLLFCQFYQMRLASLATKHILTKYFRSNSLFLLEERGEKSVQSLNAAAAAGSSAFDACVVGIRVDIHVGIK